MPARENWSRNHRDIFIIYTDIRYSRDIYREKLCHLVGPTSPPPVPPPPPPKWPLGYLTPMVPDKGVSNSFSSNGFESSFFCRCSEGHRKQSSECFSFVRRGYPWPEVIPLIGFQKFLTRIQIPGTTDSEDNPKSGESCVFPLSFNIYILKKKSPAYIT